MVAAAAAAGIDIDFSIETNHYYLSIFFSIGRAMRQQQLKLSWAELSVLLERVKRSHPKRIRHGYRSELDFVCDSMPRYDLRLYVDLIVSFVFLAYAKLISDLTSSVAASFACSV